MFEIRLAENNDIKIIVDLLDKVTLDLHKKSINQWKYPWDIEEISIEINKKIIHVMIEDEIIIGTFSLRYMGTNSKIQAIQSNNLYLYRIAILPAYQGRSLGLKVINYAFHMSKSLKRILYLDCWAGNEKLKDFYSKSGFEYCGDFKEEDYMISVFKYL